MANVLKNGTNFGPMLFSWRQTHFRWNGAEQRGGGDNQKSKQTIDARQSINGKKGKVLIDTTKEKRDNYDARLQRPIR